MVINDLFNGQSFYRIPIYQRGYSWGEEQIDAFLNDIDNLFGNEIPHYMGMIGVEDLMMSNNEEKIFRNWIGYNNYYSPSSFKFYHIVDGQQRLLTIIILLSHLIRFIKEEDRLWFNINKNSIKIKYIHTQSDPDAEKFYWIGYDADEISNNYLINCILQNEKYKRSNAESNTYTQNLKNAKIKFLRYLKRLNQNELKALFLILTTRLQFDFNIFKSGQISMIFETMNDRGKPLTNLEKLKNRLIYVNSIVGPDNGMQHEIHKTWSKLYGYLGKNPNIPLDDDFFLKNHAILYYRYDRSEEEFYRKILFEDEFTIKEAIKSKHISITNKNLSLSFRVKNYVESLNKSIEQWFYIYNPLHKETREVKRNRNILVLLNKLNYLGLKFFPPLIMGIFLHDEPESKIIKLLSVMENHIFILFYFSMKRADTGSSFFYNKSSEYLRYKQKNSEEKVDIDFIINQIEEYWTYGKKKDQSDSYIEVDAFYSYIKDQFVRDRGKGFYSWIQPYGIKYFLMEYELSLKNSPLKETEDLIDYDDHSFSVQPIFATKLKDDDSDFEIMESDVGIRSTLENMKKNLSEDELKLRLKKIKYSLGNFVLVRGRPQFQTKTFQRKRNEFLNRDSLANEREVFEKENWTPKDVLERGIKLLEFMESRWRFKFSDFQMDKKRMLFLDFL